MTLMKRSVSPQVTVFRRDKRVEIWAESEKFHFFSTFSLDNRDAGRIFVDFNCLTDG